MNEKSQKKKDFEKSKILICILCDQSTYYGPTLYIKPFTLFFSHHKIRQYSTGHQKSKGTHFSKILKFFYDKNWKFFSLFSKSSMDPTLIFGLCLPSASLPHAISAALDAGIRWFDTAKAYKNEKVVGEIFRKEMEERKLLRRDIVVISK